MHTYSPDRCRVNGRYRIAHGAPVLEAPLTDAQQSALVETQAYAARAAETRRASPAPRIDATAGGRFQGWRVP